MRTGLLLGFTLALLAAPRLGLAAPGDLDPTFGTGGIVRTPVVPLYDGAWDVLVQPDGKIVAVGQARGATVDFALARYLEDGTLDDTFGTDGIVITPVGPGEDIPNAVVRQPDGKLLVVGHSNNGANNDIALVRYLEDGTLDDTFGIGGIVTTPVGSANEAASSVALQSDGKIVIAGNANVGTTDPVVARYESDGTLDASFGSGGIVVVPVGSGTDTLSSVAIQ